MSESLGGAQETFALTNTFFGFTFKGMGKLLSSTEAAARVGLSVARIQTFIWDGRLPAVKVGRSYAIDEDDLRLIENRKTGRPPKAKASGADGKVAVKPGKKGTQK